jgi:hypothetical protein
MPISRRGFLSKALQATTSATLLTTLPYKAQAQTPDHLTLENEHTHITLDRNTGTIVTLQTKDGAWNLQGNGLRLHVPAPEHRLNYLTERNAPSPTIVSTTPNSVTITWLSFTSDRLGKLDIQLIQTIQLHGPAIHFAYTIHNATPYTIESYTYPRLTGLKTPAPDTALHSLSWNYSSLSSSPLYPNFSNHVGYFGYDLPAQLRNLGTDTQFLLLQSDTRGLYIASHDPTQQQVIQICLALTPAYADSFNSSATDPTHTIPDASVLIDPNHLCFIQPHSTQLSQPLVFTPYLGDWHAGADLYKTWRATWFKRRASPAWVQTVHAWQQIQINSSEDRLEFPYKDLVKYAQACQRLGIKAIQLTGWQIGGQDRDFPLHDTDPRLGTHAEFKQAIADSRALGVEIILFNKYAWADVTAPAYKSTFRQYTILDPYGDPYQFNGYNYDTPTQIAGINARHGAGLCPASPLWRQRALQEFRKSVDLGASGILFDECQWHISPFCFSKSHQHEFPGRVFSGDVPLIETFRTIIDPEKFLFAGESPYDTELQTYNMSYYRIGGGFIPFARYLDPHAPMSVAVTGFNDRPMINACLLYRLAISYEPRDFHGKLDEFPATTTYGRLVDDLRRRYADAIWHSEFRDTLGATVTANGHSLNTYAVYRRPDGRRAIAIANLTHGDSLNCQITLDPPPQNPLQLATPEDPTPRPYTNPLNLPPGQAAILLES